jgi:hypothetical protein
LGNAPQYLTNTLIKITSSSKLDEEKTYRVKGFEAKVELVKSRTAPAGRAITMIYNQSEGFDGDLSLLEYIKANGMLKGAGVSYFLEGLESNKFRLGDFKNKLREDKQLADHFYSLGRATLAASLKESSRFGGTEVVVEEIQEEPVVGDE